MWKEFTATIAIIRFLSGKVYCMGHDYINENYQSELQNYYPYYYQLTEPYFFLLDSRLPDLMVDQGTAQFPFMTDYNKQLFLIRETPPMHFKTDNNPLIGQGMQPFHFASDIEIDLYTDRDTAFYMPNDKRFLSLERSARPFLPMPDDSSEVDTDRMSLSFAVNQEKVAPIDSYTGLHITTNTKLNPTANQGARTFLFINDKVDEVGQPTKENFRTLKLKRKKETIPPSEPVTGTQLFLFEPQNIAYLPDEQPSGTFIFTPKNEKNPPLDQDTGPFAFKHEYHPVPYFENVSQLLPSKPEGMGNQPDDQSSGPFPYSPKNETVLYTDQNEGPFYFLPENQTVSPFGSMTQLIPSEPKDITNQTVDQHIRQFSALQNNETDPIEDQSTMLIPFPFRSDNQTVFQDQSNVPFPFRQKNDNHVNYGSGPFPLRAKQSEIQSNGKEEDTDAKEEDGMVYSSRKRVKLQEQYDSSKKLPNYENKRKETNLEMSSENLQNYKEQITIYPKTTNCEISKPVLSLVSKNLNKKPKWIHAYNTSPCQHTSCPGPPFPFRRKHPAEFKIGDIGPYPFRLKQNPSKRRMCCQPQNIVDHLVKKKKL